MLVTTDNDTPTTDTVSKRRTTLAEKAQLQAIARDIHLKRRRTGKYYARRGNLLWPSWYALEGWVVTRYHEKYGALPSQSGIAAFARLRQRLAEVRSA